MMLIILLNGFLAGIYAQVTAYLDNTSAELTIVSQSVIFDVHDEKVVSYMVGYDPKLGGEPWQMKNGSLPANDSKVVLDWIMVAKHEIAIGDTIDMVSKPLSLPLHQLRNIRNPLPITINSLIS